MKLLTVTEAAAVKGVTKQAISAAIKSGRLPVVTIQLPVVRIDSEELKRFQLNPNMRRTGRPRRSEGKHCSVSPSCVNYCDHERFLSI